MRVELLYILMGLCLVWVAAAIALGQYLAHLARRGNSGTEIMALALAPYTASAALLGAPLGSVMAFVLASGHRFGPGRIVLTIVGGALAAFFGANVLGAVRDLVRNRRRKRQHDRVLGQAETIGLIKSGAIAGLTRFKEGVVLVTYTDNAWVDGVYDWSRAQYADPAGWSLFEAVGREIPGARLHDKALHFRDDYAHRRQLRG